MCGLQLQRFRSLWPLLRGFGVEVHVSQDCQNGKHWFKLFINAYYLNSADIFVQCCSLLLHFNSFNLCSGSHMDFKRKIQMGFQTSSRYFNHQAQSFNLPLGFLETGLMASNPQNPTQKGKNIDESQDLLSINSDVIPFELKQTE